MHDEKSENDPSKGVHLLTLRLFLVCFDVLRHQNFIKSVIGHLQHKAPVHHTVARLESSVDDVTMVQVLHSLGIENFLVMREHEQL